MARLRKTLLVGLMTVLLGFTFLSDVSPVQGASQPGDKLVTRGEFVQELVTAMDVDLQDATDLPFTDVDADLAPFVDAALRLGITTGKTSTTFAPNEKVTREQAYVFLIRTLNLRDFYCSDALDRFKDERAIGEWSENEIAAAVELGLTTGFPDKTFKPHQPITERQVDTILDRYEENFEIITLLHTNDTHGRVLHNEANGEMGFAKIASIVNDVRTDNPNTLLFDIGDTFHGTNYVNMNKGEALVKIFNAMKFDAMTVGNHDFNYGQERLLELKAGLEFPMISANIMKDGTQFLTPDTTVIKEVGGRKIGLIGLTSIETAVKTNPAGIKGITFEDELATTEKLVKELEGKVDEIVLLSHSGLYVDEKIADEVEGVDVILGGHSQDAVETPQKFTHAYVAQAHEYTKALGQTNLIYYKGKLIGVNGFLYRDSGDKLQDPTIMDIIKPYQEETDATMSEVIGTIDVDLDGARENVRTKETNLGNLIADAMRTEIQTDVAFTNGGGIRESIPAGEVTRKDIFTTLPFDNTLVKVTLTGEDLKAALEHGVRLYPEQNGGFPHVSGMSFSFDPTKPAYERVTEVKVGGEPLDLTKSYTVATLSFIADGGDGYTMFTPEKVEFNSGEVLNTIVIKYMQSLEKLPEVEGRVVCLSLPE